jgi:hypothetical protein
VGIVGTVHVLLPELSRLSASIRQASTQLKDSEHRSISLQFSGPGFEAWKTATARLLHATDQEISRVASPAYVQYAIPFVNQCAFYILMAAVGGWKQIDRDAAAMRQQIAELSETYRRALKGDWGAPGQRLVTPGGSANGPMVRAWDALVNAVTRGVDSSGREVRNA